MTTSNRKPCVAGNWKMVGTRNRITDLMQALSTKISALEHSEKIDIVVCPPFPYLQLVGELLQNPSNTKVSSTTQNSPITLGAQNVYPEPEGAFTGEISTSMLSDLNCQYVIIGHSERRQWLQETDELIARKFRAAYDAGLIPILCVGETAAERAAGQTIAVVARQLEAVLKETGPAAFKRALLAYEPVWAIGTGQTATPAQAAEVHTFLRSLFKPRDEVQFKAGPEVQTKQDTPAEDYSNQVRILYGGSVKANNAAALFAEPDIDGALVGGASLNADEFLSICQAAISSALHPL